MILLRAADNLTAKLFDSRQDFFGDGRPNVDKDSSFGILLQWDWLCRDAFGFSLAAHLIDGIEELRVDLLLLSSTLILFLTHWRPSADIIRREDCLHTSYRERTGKDQKPIACSVHAGTPIPFSGGRSFRWLGQQSKY